MNLKKISPTGSVFFQSMVIFQEMVPGGFPVDPTRKRRFILIYSIFSEHSFGVRRMLVKLLTNTLSGKFSQNWEKLEKECLCFLERGGEGKY